MAVLFQLTNKQKQIIEQKPNHQLHIGIQYPMTERKTRQEIFQSLYKPTFTEFEYYKFIHSTRQQYLQINAIHLFPCLSVQCTRTLLL